MADTIKLKAPTVEQQVIVNIQGEDKLKSFSETLDKLSKGRNLQKYWKDQQTLINDTIKAYSNFKRYANEDTSSELLKTTNALKAMGNVDLSSLSPELKNINISIKQAEGIAGHLVDAFSVSSFKDAFGVFETFRAYGLDLQQIFKHFEVNADVDKLNADLKNANTIIGNLKGQIGQLQDRLEDSESGNGIRAIREECENLQWEIDKIRQEAEEMFSAFLKSNNIDQYSGYTERYFRDIQDGSITAQEAIADFKREYSYLLENNASFDTIQLQDFSKRLDDVSIKINEVAEKINEISANGVKVSETSGSGNIEELADAINKIGNVSDSNITSIYDGLSKVLITIKEIGQTDSDNLFHIYAILKNLSKLEDLKINKSSLNNLADCIERICRIDNTSSLSNLSLVDLQKFNNLQIKKASLKNLAEYLPLISNINVDTLVELSRVNFSNLSNFKVDKASLESLRNFAESLRSVIQNNSENIDTKIAEKSQTSLDTENTEKLEKATEEAVQAKREFSEANDIVKDSANDSKTPLQLEAEIMEQIAQSAREAANAKREFVEANKQLKEITDTSISSLKNENDEFKEDASSKKKDKYAKRNKISEDDFLDNSAQYAFIANKKLKDSGYTILGETVNTELVNGLVKVIAKIKDADGAWKSFSARIDADGNIFEQRFKAITKNVDKLETDLETKEEILSVNKAKNILINTEKEYLSLKEKSTSLTDEEITKLKKLDSLRKRATNVVNTDAINKTSETMKKLQYSGTGKTFENVFDKAQQKIQSLNEQLKAEDISLEEYSVKVSQIQNQLKNKKTIDFIDVNSLKEAQNVMKTLATDIAGADAKIDISGNKLTATWTNQNGVVQKLAMSYDELTGALTQTQNSLSSTQSKSNSFFNKLKQGWTNVLQYATSFMSFYEIINFLKQGFNTVKELDAALTEMKKVSDESVQSLRNFQDVSFDIAGSVGTTAQQIQNSTADFMRLGESLDEASKSAEVSNILLNVSEFESIDEATQSLVAMSAAYNELDKIEIVDKLNNIGNNFAISTDGLATALQESASALKTAGNDMDEAIALVTAGNQVVQDPDSVGAGLRTIALRITGTEAAKAELESLGEDVTDFIVQTSAKSQEAIRNFTKVASNNYQGFNILDNNGNFKSTYDILLGISTIYKEILETDQKYGTNMANGLLETLAGKNRANIAASILQNPDILKSAYESSQESFGSAQEELDSHLDSINGKIELFKNELQQFWHNLLSSDTAKKIVDAGTAILDKAGDIVDVLGEIGTLIVTITGALKIRSIVTNKNNIFSTLLD